MDRRVFLKSIAAAGALASLPVEQLHARRPFVADYLSLHPFIDKHPEAVFIMRTSVSSKIATDEKLEAGHKFASLVFQKSTSPGIPFDWNIAMKPNLTCTSGTGGTVEGMGIRTDIPFLEGFLLGISDLKFPMDAVSMREGNVMGSGYCPTEGTIGEADDMASRLGMHYLDFQSGRKAEEITYDTMIEGQEVIWTDCPDGVVFRRIPSVAPFNAEKTWLLNIAKFKAHSMGLTLASKNLQGAVMPPFTRFCETLEQTLARPQAMLDHFQPDFDTSVKTLYQQHRTSIPRWDRPGADASGGLGMESWAQRTCDWLSVQPEGLHVIEGIYGRNGDGFNAGPGSGGSPEEFMSNIIIFGKNPLLVDVIGNWLGGHEPGNFGLFHIAYQRRLISTFNPESVPLFLWNGDDPVATSIKELQRTPLLTQYLRKDYNGGSEAQYHLVNESFDYRPYAVDKTYAPEAFVLGQNHSNPFASSTIIEYRMPRSGYARLDVYNSSGDRVAVLADGWALQGAHAVTWNSGTNPPGAYFYRFSSSGFSVTRKMLLVR